MYRALLLRGINRTFSSKIATSTVVTAHLSTPAATVNSSSNQQQLQHNYMRQLIIDVQKKRAQRQAKLSFQQFLIPQCDEKPSAMDHHIVLPIVEAFTDTKEAMVDISKGAIDVIEDEKLDIEKDEYTYWEKRVEELDGDSMPPTLQPSQTLAPYVPRSETLMELVKLGVDLSRVEKVPGGADALVLLDFHRDVMPTLLYFQDLGVPSGDLARVISVFPKVFKMPITLLEERVQYFTSKQFTRDAVVNIIVKQPTALSKSPVEVDSQLGKLQKLFVLTGNEIRSMITSVPKLITFQAEHFAHLNTIMKKMFCLKGQEVHSIVVEHPKILLTSKHLLVRNFIYLHTNLGLEHDTIVLNPRALTVSVRILKERVGYLIHAKKLQLDKTKPLYTSLDKVVSTSDKIFCEHFAHISPSEFDTYLKTL